MGTTEGEAEFLCVDEGEDMEEEEQRSVRVGRAQATELLGEHLPPPPFLPPIIVPSSTPEDPPFDPFLPEEVDCCIALNKGMLTCVH